MKAFSITIAVLSLSLGGLLLFRIRSRASLWLIFPKFLGTALAPYVALAGALGAVLGLVHGSILAIGAGAVGAALAADYVRRVTAPHNGFKLAFGSNWTRRIPPESAKRMLRRRWTWREPSVPEPRWTRDVAFWTIPGSARKLLADIWQPPGGVEQSGTAIVYLHGSAWYLWDKDCGTRPFFRRLAAQGHVVMDVAYRLCPEVNVVGMVGDAKRAVAWMKANAARFGVNPQRVVLMGASAGGHVALLAAYGSNHPRLTPEELNGVDTSVMAVVSYYGVPDLRAYCENSVSHFEGRPEQLTAAAERPRPGRLDALTTRMFCGRWLPIEQLPPTPPHRRIMLDLVGGQPDEAPDMYDLASPIHHVSAASPPTLLFQGEHDWIVPVASARRLYHALAAAGAPVVYVEFPRTVHGFDLLFPRLSPAGQAALYDLERFLPCVVVEDGKRMPRPQPAATPY
jgi:acetyl esterase/lipase